jgi:hypothetical protein
VATLAVRPLAPRDIPLLGRVYQRVEPLDIQGDDPVVPDLSRRIVAAAIRRAGQERMFVASVDGELCALLSARPHERSFRWDLTAVTAGSPRLDATDDVCIELWTAMAEYAIRRAGEAGIKRLFAATHEDGPAHESLRLVGFDGYARHILIRGRVESALMALPPGMRPQEESDVWSIHQLYHRTTPRAVQFAEALTSTAWELQRSKRWNPPMFHRPDVAAFVLETTDGIEAYCRVEQRPHRAVATLLVSDACHDHIPGFVHAAAFQAGIRSATPLDIIVAEYQIDLVRRFEESGFVVQDERVALVRHTTVPALVHSRLNPLPAVESAERVPKGVPSYYYEKR